MFTTMKSKPHSARKRMLSNIYSKSYIHNSTTMEAVSRVLFLSRFLPNLKALEANGPFNIFAFFSAATMDFVASYIFGVAATPNMTDHKDERDRILHLYHSRQSYSFWPQELPRFTRLLKRIGIRLVPKWVDSATQQIEDWVLSMCTKAEQFQSKEFGTAKPEDTPEVYQQMRRALRRFRDEAGDLEQDEKLAIASEMMDHLTAGFDTSSITLTYLVHEISKRQDLQKTLRDELQHIESPLRYRPGAEELEQLPAPKDLDKLPLLGAIIQETLRLRSAIPAPQPRVTPDGGCVLGPQGEYRVPEGVRVSAQAHSLHRNAEVFDEPESWKPERWLVADEAKLKEMNRWFWAFGSGGRMCIGSNLALYRELMI
jgi:cytochrome P450